MERESILVRGFLMLTVLLGTLMFLDGYLFYRTILKERGQAEAVKEVFLLNQAKIDEVVKLLDERQKIFEGVLRGETRE